jgi:hypothetical protein
MFVLHLLEIVLSGGYILLRVHFHLLRLMIQHNEIPVHKIETVQFITGLLRIHDIFVDDVGRAFGRVGGACSDLADRPVFAKEIEERLGVDIVGKIFDEEDTVGLGGKLVTLCHGLEVGGSRIDPAAPRAHLPAPKSLCSGCRYFWTRPNAKAVEGGQRRRGERFGGLRAQARKSEGFERSDVETKTSESLSG